MRRLLEGQLHPQLIGDFLDQETGLEITLKVQRLDIPFQRQVAQETVMMFNLLGEDLYLAGLFERGCCNLEPGFVCQKDAVRN